jgi:hypothetical protein
LTTIGLLVVVSGAIVEELLAGHCMVAGTFLHPEVVPSMPHKRVLFLRMPVTGRKMCLPHC